MAALAAGCPDVDRLLTRRKGRPGGVLRSRERSSGVAGGGSTREGSGRLGGGDTTRVLERLRGTYAMPRWTLRGGAELLVRGESCCRSYTRARFHLGRRYFTVARGLWTAEPPTVTQLPVEGGGQPATSSSAHCPRMAVPLGHNILQGRVVEIDH